MRQSRPSLTFDLQPFVITSPGSKERDFPLSNGASRPVFDVFSVVIFLFILPEDLPFPVGDTSIVFDVIRPLQPGHLLDTGSDAG